MTSTQAADNLLSRIEDIIDFELANAVDPVWPGTDANCVRPEFRRPNAAAVLTQRNELWGLFDACLTAYRLAVSVARQQDEITLRKWSEQLSSYVSEIQHWERPFTGKELTQEEFREMSELHFQTKTYLQINLPSVSGVRLYIERLAYKVKINLGGVIIQLAKEHFQQRLEASFPKNIPERLQEGTSDEELLEEMRTSWSNINPGAVFRLEVPRFIGQSVIEEKKVGENLPQQTSNTAANSGDECRLTPSLEVVHGVYEWAMLEISDADAMTIPQLFDAIQLHPMMKSDFLERLPNNSDTFGKYLKRAGIDRYNTSGSRKRRPSRRPRS